LTRQIIKVLGLPLACLNLHEQVECQSSVKNDCRVCAERCVGLLLELHPDIIKLIADIRVENESIERRWKETSNHRQSSSATELNDEPDDEQLTVEESTSETGLGVLIYLVLGEHVGTDGIPQVYDHKFLLEFAFCSISLLLNGGRSTVVHKGVLVCSELLSNVSNEPLDASLYEWEQTHNIIEAIIRVMTSSRVKEVCHRPLDFSAPFSRLLISKVVDECSSFCLNILVMPAFRDMLYFC